MWSTAAATSTIFGPAFSALAARVTVETWAFFACFRPANAIALGRMVVARIALPRAAMTCVRC